MKNKVEAEKTVLLTLFEPTAVKEEFTKRVIVYPLFNPSFEANGETIRCKIPFPLSGEPKNPCHVALALTDDPSVHSADSIGSLGYTRLLFKMEDAIIKCQKDCCFIVTKRDKCSWALTVPER